MDTFATCTTCFQDSDQPKFVVNFTPYYEDRISYYECPRGHKSAFVLQAQKFEVLMESGTKALCAGFTLEAAASFATSLERFFEFALKVMLIDMGLDKETYDAMFTEMARQSERQVGGFLAMYAITFREPYIPVKKIANFRNSVIHKGEVPTPEKCKEFCSLIYSEIFRLTNVLGARCSDSMHQVVAADYSERARHVPSDVPIVLVSGSYVFSLADGNRKPDFASALAAYQRSVLASDDLINRAQPMINTALANPDFAMWMLKAQKE